MAPGSAQNEATQKLLAQLWRRNLPVLNERLNFLDASAKAAQDRTLTLHRQQEARDIAHKLAGSLGMFGYPQCTAIARQLDQLLDQPAPDPDAIASLVQQLHRELSAAL